LKILQNLFQIFPNFSKYFPKIWLVVAKLLRTVLRNLRTGWGVIEILGRFGKDFERGLASISKGVADV
jgi:hypothetical protein